MVHCKKSYQTYSVAGPRVCSYLPTDLRQPDLLYSVSDDLWSLGPERSVNQPLVGVEFCCSACVFRIEVRPHHATPDTVALAEGARAHQV